MKKEGILIGIIIVLSILLTGLETDLATPVGQPDITKARLTEIHYYLDSYDLRSVTLVGYKSTSTTDVEKFSEVIEGSDFDTFIATFKADKIARLNAALRTRGILGPTDSLSWWE